jgi:hypothetical protein
MKVRKNKNIFKNLPYLRIKVQFVEVRVNNNQYFKMSNPTPLRPQPPINDSAISKQASTTPSSTVYSCEQQTKLLNLQEEIDLLLAQIQAETNLLATR